MNFTDNFEDRNLQCPRCTLSVSRYWKDGCDICKDWSNELLEIKLKGRSENIETFNGCLLLALVTVIILSLLFGIFVCK